MCVQWPCRDDTAEQNAESITVSPLSSHEKGEWSEDYNKFDGLKTFRRKSHYLMILNNYINIYRKDSVTLKAE